MTASLAAQLEAATIELWFHLASPLDNWGVYETLTDGMVQAKQDYQRARAAHDHDRAAAALAEIGDLNALCAACADALALQRLRFLAGDHPWPLGRI